MLQESGACELPICFSDSRRERITRSQCPAGRIMKPLRTSPTPPPWEVVSILSHRLHPRTLAVASSVCRAWRSIMSSDHLWKHICLSYRPSLYSLGGDNASSYRALFALSQSSASGRARRQQLPKPIICLEDLIFAIDVFCADGPPLFSMTVPGNVLATAAASHGDVFRFYMSTPLGADESVLGSGAGTVRMMWTVLTKGLKGAFTVMDAKGGGREGGFGKMKDLWLSEELPPPSCCSSLAPSGLTAEVALVFSGPGVPKLSLGLLDATCWGYAKVDDALRYLQHFLLPGDHFICTSRGGG